MSGRTKTLAIAVGLLAGGWFYVEVLLGPVLAREEAASKEVAKAKGELNKLQPLLIREAELKRKNVRTQGDLLSRDRSAVALMLTKLFDLVRSAATFQAVLKQIREERREDLYTEVTYEIQGQTTYTGLMRLVFEIDHLPEYVRLRKVTSLGKDGKLDINVQVSVLELVRATIPGLKPNSPLAFAPDKPKWDVTRTAVERSLFEPARPAEAKRDPPKPQDTPPKSKSKPSTLFTGVVRDADGTVRAIIENHEKNEFTLVKQGDSYGAYHVEAISLDRLSVSSGDTKKEISLGDPLSDQVEPEGSPAPDGKTLEDSKPREQRNGWLRRDKK